MSSLVCQRIQECELGRIAWPMTVVGPRMPMSLRMADRGRAVAPHHLGVLEHALRGMQRERDAPLLRGVETVAQQRRPSNSRSASATRRRRASLEGCFGSPSMNASAAIEAFAAARFVPIESRASDRRRASSARPRSQAREIRECRTCRRYPPSRRRSAKYRTPVVTPDLRTSQSATSSDARTQRGVGHVEPPGCVRRGSSCTCSERRAPRGCRDRRAVAQMRVHVDEAGHHHQAGGRRS